MEEIIRFSIPISKLLQSKYSNPDAYMMIMALQDKKDYYESLDMDKLKSECDAEKFDITELFSKEAIAEAYRDQQEDNGMPPWYDDYSEKTKEYQRQMAECDRRLEYEEGLVDDGDTDEDVGDAHSALIIALKAKNNVRIVLKLEDQKHVEAVVESLNIPLYKYGYNDNPPTIIVAYGVTEQCGVYAVTFVEEDTVPLMGLFTTIRY